MRTRRVTAIAALLLVTAGCGSSAGEATLTTVTTSTVTTTVEVSSSTTAPSSTVPPATLPSEAAPPQTTRPVAPVTTRPAPPAPPTSRPAPPTSRAPTTSAPLPAAAALTIKNFAFAPDDVHVARGATVTTTNQDGATHTWTADDGSWTSAPIAPGAKSSHRFDAAGSFTYHCEIHPSMQGRVVVG